MKSESDIYKRLGLQYVPPEMREDVGEIEAALKGKLPEDLITTEDIRGMVHCHTMYSDGKHSVEQMVATAEALGMKYITITDHSPTAFYAGGVKIDRLQAAVGRNRSRTGANEDQDFERHRVRHSPEWIAGLSRLDFGAVRRDRRQHSFALQDEL